MKNNYTSTKNNLKANPENKTIEQSYQALKTERGRQAGEMEGLLPVEGPGSGLGALPSLLPFCFPPPLGPQPSTHSQFSRPGVSCSR